MAILTNSSRPLAPHTGVVSLTIVQSALWHLRLPVLDAKAVAGHRDARSVACCCERYPGHSWVLHFWSHSSVSGGIGRTSLKLPRQERRSWRFSPGC